MFSRLTVWYQKTNYVFFPWKNSAFLSCLLWEFIQPILFRYHPFWAWSHATCGLICREPVVLCVSLRPGRVSQIHLSCLKGSFAIVQLIFRQSCRLQFMDTNYPLPKTKSHSQIHWSSNSLSFLPLFSNVSQALGVEVCWDQSP